MSKRKAGATATRSVTSAKEDEDRRRFLEAGAEAAEEGRCAAGQLNQNTSKDGAASGNEPSPPVPTESDQGLDNVTPRRERVEPSGGLPPADSSVYARDSPRSPSAEARSTAINGAVPRTGERPADTHTQRKHPEPSPSRVSFAKPKPVTRTPRRPRSTSSSRAATLRKEAELQAQEEMAELKRQEIRLNRELVNKRLETRLSQIDAQSGKDSASEHSDDGYVDEWLESSQVEGDRLRDGHLPDYEPATRDPEQGGTRSPRQEVRRNTRHRPPEVEAPRPSPVDTEPRTQYTAHTQYTAAESAAASMMQVFEKMQMAARPAPKEIYELPPFYGNASEWRCFYNTYRETSTRYKFTDYENVARLRVALKGEAKQCVQHILATATRPDLIMKILKKQFGRSEVLLDQALEDLRRMSPVGPSAHDLNNFAIKIMNIVSTVIDVDHRHYADNPMLIREITDRLSPHLRSRWCDYARSHRHVTDPEIMQLAEFLMQESEQELLYSHARAPTASRRVTGAAAAGRARYPTERQPTASAARTYAGGSQARRAPVAPMPSRAAYVTQQVRNVKTTCLFCGGLHNTTECRKLSSLTVGARWDWAKQNRMCYRCMDAKHMRYQCKAKGCDKAGCSMNHHGLLHEDRNMDGAAEDAPVHATREAALPPAPRQALRSETMEPEVAEEVAERAYTTTSSSNVLLKVLPVRVEGPHGTAHIFAMLDDASTLSVVEADIADQIGLTGPESPLCVRGLGNIAHRAQTRTVKARIRPHKGEESYEVILRTVDGIGLRSQTLNKQRMMKYDHLKDLGEECYTTGVPQMLIGADHWHLLAPQEVRAAGRKEPAALRCALGWCFVGAKPTTTVNTEQRTMHCRQEDDRELDELLKQHWTVESLGIKRQDNVKPADERAMNIFESTVTKIKGGYEVGQLWMEEKPQLPLSYANAYSRLMNLEARMRKDKEFASEYCKHIQALFEKGFAEPVESPPRDELAFYLPHFPVTNIQKNKIRPVFDCAAKSMGRCLNDFILSGPDLLQNLMGILLRFRENKYAVTADIQDMFLRIRIREKDQSSQLFLWRSPEEEGPPRVCKLTRVLFGCVSSPCLAHLVRNRNAEDNKEKYPDAVYDIKTNHYMDDYVSSYETEKELLHTVKQVRESHAKGGFNLRSFASNSQQLMESVDESLHAIEPTALGQKSQRVLGMIWDPATDSLGFNTSLLRVPDKVKRFEQRPTKRQVLSTVMSIYDPLGLISHYVITAKIILQRIWTKGTKWDQELDDQDSKDFFDWLQALEHVATLQIPRRYLNPEGGETERSLHIFVDASAEAYCAVAYWRCETNGEVQVSLAAGKARVSPLKILSIPKMELCAAWTGARLAATVLREQRYETRDIVYWTDSKTTWSWIRDDARQYKPFVSHRLAEIAELTDRNAWRWIPTKLNPADDATRAKPTRIVTIEERWYQGPPFLKQPKTEWPPLLEESNIDRTKLPERKQSSEVYVTLEAREPASVLPDVKRFSNYDRLIRSTAYVLLFVEKLRTRNRSLTLQLRHLRDAEHRLYQSSQRRSFPDEIRALHAGKQLDRKSRIYKLAPELSRDGVLRMKTRMGNAPVKYTALNPVILDGRDLFTKLLIDKIHRKSAHIHNEAVVNELRQKFWILHLRPAVKSVVRSCAICILHRAAPRAQPLGDLPQERTIAFERAFTYSAVDYAGPVYVTIGRRREKRWIALYTCLTTRAVHLECVHSLSADSALLALRRFAARRGWPRVMWSDNGTNFRAAALELQAAYKEWLPLLQEYGLHHRMDWKFIPPGNPSAGGAWERMVRTVKTAMAYTFNARAPREEIFLTTLAEIEYVVNERPLTHVSVDPDDPETLTPNRFLLMKSANLPIYGPYEENEMKKWKTAQMLADHFWRRWIKEVYPLLAPRGSSDSGGRQVQRGDVVIIVDPAGPRNTWPKGVVEATYQGPDGRVRSADVRTACGVLRRPTCKLAVVVKQLDEPGEDNVTMTPHKQDEDKTVSLPLQQIVFIKTRGCDVSDTTTHKQDTLSSHTTERDITERQGRRRACAVRAAQPERRACAVAASEEGRRACALFRTAEQRATTA